MMVQGIVLKSFRVYNSSYKHLIWKTLMFCNKNGPLKIFDSRSLLPIKYLILRLCLLYICL